jgi:hypothetical protein
MFALDIVTSMPSHNGLHAHSLPFMFIIWYEHLYSICMLGNGLTGSQLMLLFSVSTEEFLGVMIHWLLYTNLGIKQGE